MKVMKSLVLAAILCVAQVKAIDFSSKFTGGYDGKLGEGLATGSTGTEGDVDSSHITDPADVYDESLKSGVETKFSAKLGTEETPDQAKAGATEPCIEELSTAGENDDLLYSENADATDAASCDHEFSLAEGDATDDATVTSTEDCTDGLAIAGLDDCTDGLALAGLDDCTDGLALAGLDDCSQGYDIAQTETDTETANGGKPTESESVENDTVNTKGGASGVESSAEVAEPGAEGAETKPAGESLENDTVNTKSGASGVESGAKPGAEVAKPGAEVAEPGAEVAEPGAEVAEPGAEGAETKPAGESLENDTVNTKGGASVVESGAKLGEEAANPGAEVANPGAEVAEPGAEGAETKPAGESLENDTVNTKGGASGAEFGTGKTDAVEKDSETVLQSDIPADTPAAKTDDSINPGQTADPSTETSTVDPDCPDEYDIAGNDDCTKEYDLAGDDDCNNGYELAGADDCNNGYEIAGADDCSQGIELAGLSDAIESASCNEEFPIAENEVQDTGLTDAPAAAKSEEVLTADLTASALPVESLESELTLTLSPSAATTANSDSTTASVGKEGDPNTAKQTAFSVEAVKFQSADHPTKTIPVAPFVAAAAACAALAVVGAIYMKRRSKKAKEAESAIFTIDKTSAL